ncbi:MAG: hypothetical protein KGL63_13960 [Betaproteobacteria bacterium]|nr:hypothetical protein [Betaproteobacteria bacterium]
MVKDFLRQRLSAGLKALFDTAPWAAQRLQPFSASVIVLDLGGRCIPFAIDDQGHPELCETIPDQPQLTIRMPFSALPLFLADKNAALRELHLEGNSGLAHEVGFLARNFRPDLEELLSRVVGDLLAHRIAQSARNFQGWARDSARRLSDSLTEYVTEEGRFVTGRAAVQRFSQDVAELDQAVRRFEQRIARQA